MFTILNTNWYQIFYWISVADSVKGFFDTASNIGLGFSIVFFIVYWIIFISKKCEGISESEVEEVESNYWLKMTRRTFFYFLTFTMIFWLGYVFTPDKKALLFTVAGGATATFLTNDSSAKALPADLTNYLHLAIKEQTRNIGKDAKKDIEMALPEEKKETFLDRASEMSKEEIINYLKTDTTLIK